MTGREGVYGVSLSVVMAGVAFISAIVPTALLSIVGTAPPMLVLATLFAAVVAVLVHEWIKTRYSRPLAQTVQRLENMANAEGAVRALEGQGGREVRQVARAVNAAFAVAGSVANGAAQCKSAPRNRSRAQAEIARVAEAIRALGAGTLHRDAASLSGDFEPISQALSDAYRGLKTRIASLQESSIGVAEVAASLLPHAHRWGEVTRQLQTTVSRLAMVASDTEREVTTARSGVETGMESMLLFAAEQRRLVNDIKAQLLELSRYASEARDSADRSRMFLEHGSKLDRALTEIARGGAREGEGTLADAIGEARASQVILRREMARLCDDLDRLSDALSAVVARQPHPAADLDGRVTEPLISLADVLADASELSVQTVRVIGRTARDMAAVTFDARDALAQLSGRLPGLASSALKVGFEDAFDAAVLQLLRKAAEQSEPRAPHGLSACGLSMMAEVEASADAARARLSALVRTTEASVSMLRVG